MNDANDKCRQAAPVSKGFEERLRRCNSLDDHGFQEWVFHPAMLFGARSKWWGDQGKRDRPHEGLDLCLYRTKEGNILRLDEKTKVPVIFAGEIVKVCDDFLGESIFVSHHTFDKQGRRLHTLYGHIKPYSRMRPGMLLQEGDIIGTIAGTRKRNGAVPCHAHISVAWIPDSVPVQELDWKSVGDPKVVLLDPLTVITCCYSIEEGDWLFR